MQLNRCLLFLRSLFGRSPLVGLILPGRRGILRAQEFWCIRRVAPQEVKKTMKRLLSLVLVFALVCSAAVVPVFAAEFSDLTTDHWAYEYMMDLFERGIITGYSDGTIRPSTTATVAQTLALLSRFYALTDGDLESITTKHQAVVADPALGVNSAFYDEIAVCLEAGIITQEELHRFSSVNDKITREDFSRFLVRTMQLEDEALARGYAALNFTDVDQISADALLHIDLLAELGLIGGYSDGSFQPRKQLSRAVLSKLISLAYAYLEVHEIELGIAGYESVSSCEGILTGFDGNSLYLTGTNGLTRFFKVSDPAALEITAEDIGSYLLVTADGDQLLTARNAYAGAVSCMQGEVHYCSMTGSSKAIVLQTTAGSSARCVVSDGTEYIGCTFASLAQGNFITAVCVDGVAVSVTLSTPPASLTGTIRAVEYTLDGCELRVEDESGAVWTFLLDYSAMPTVKYGGISVSLTMVSVGDDVVCSLTDAKLTSISLASKVATITGTLSYIGQSANGTEWTVLREDGSTVTAPLSAFASFAEADGTILTADALAFGDTLTVTTHDGVVTRVVRTACASDAGISVSGTALCVNTAWLELVALVDGQTVVFDLSDAELKTAAGLSIGIGAITTGDTFLAYGSFDATGTGFVAISVILD